MDERNTRELEIIIEMFRKAELQELLVQGPELSLHLSMDAWSTDRANPLSAVRPTRTSPPPQAAIGGEGDWGVPPAATALAIDPAWTAVIAPNLGTFYRSPKPGSPPFVEVGQKVSADAELCLIEVMKLFTSVRTEIAGAVRHIAAADAQLVEGGQPLIYIEAD